jgi:hypothetical protein
MEADGAGALRPGQGRRGNWAENELELSKKRVAQWLLRVKNNYVVIRISVGYVTQAVQVARFERLAGGVKNCGKEFERTYLFKNPKERAIQIHAYASRGRLLAKSEVE